MMTDLSPPYIAGNEFAGHVHALGAGVSGLAVGQAVMGAVSPRRPGGGSDTEYICVPSTYLAAVKNPAADLTLAATLPMNGLTALLALDAVRAPDVKSILVTGGAGALGGYVIQLAKLEGLTVVADAKESDVALLTQLGATHIVPRGEGMAAAVRALFPNGVDAAVDCALLRDAAAAAVRDGGGVVALRSTIRLRDERVVNRRISVTAQPPDPAGLQRLADLWEKGAITPRVAVRTPMADARQAHRQVEAGGLRGRVVLTF